MAALWGPTPRSELARERPEAIVLDLGMPGMSGYSVARQIRAEPALANVLLIALTGWDQEDRRVESAQAGFDHHLVKPVGLATLAGVLAGSRPPERRPDGATDPSRPWPAARG